MAKDLGKVGGLQSWTIAYVSSAVDGTLVPVTGTVAVPATATTTGPRPLLTWAHGTTGLGDTCAPSKSYVEGKAAENLLASAATAQGWAFVATDYQGLGTAGDHPYLVGRSEGPNVLDAARAAEQLTATGVTSASKVLVLGHSQGGGSAAFAAELQPTYAPDLNVVGSILGAPASELSRPTAFFSDSQYPFAVMAASGFNVAYPALSLSDVLTPKGVSLIPAMRNECNTAIFNSFAGVPRNDVIKASPNSVPAWADEVTANTPGSIKTAVPMFIFHGEADETVPVADSKALLARYCATGDVVLRKTYAKADHTSVIGSALIDILSWANDRLAGKPAPTSC